MLNYVNRWYCAVIFFLLSGGSQTEKCITAILSNQLIFILPELLTTLKTNKNYEADTFCLVCTTKIQNFNIFSYTFTHVCKGNTYPAWEKKFENL
jgi:hypothetical protein